MTLKRMLTVVGVAAATVLGFTGTALAHTPVLLDQTDQLPWLAPKAVDGADEFGWYGTLPKKGAVRSFQLAMDAGDPLNVRLAVPNQAPENGLALDKLPLVVVIAPNGTPTAIEPTMRVAAHVPEPEPGLDVLRLHEYSTTAVSGTYTFVVVGRAPSRFAIATGAVDEFHGLRRGAPAPGEQIFEEWYYKAP